MVKGKLTGKKYHAINGEWACGITDVKRKGKTRFQVSSASPPMLLPERRAIRPGLRIHSGSGQTAYCAAKMALKVLT